MPDSTAVDAAIRSRRTVKSYDDTPVPPAVLNELFELASHAPNHRMTEPWRFRVLGPKAFEALCEVAGAGSEKLWRAPTLVAVSCEPSPLPLHAEEDMHAAACALYIIMLSAHARGIATYWRTPAILRAPAGRAACQVADGERVLGLLHLGYASESVPMPERSDIVKHVAFLP